MNLLIMPLQMVTDSLHCPIQASDDSAFVTGIMEETRNDKKSYPDFIYRDETLHLICR
jgi:hypothetical protein